MYRYTFNSRVTLVAAFLLGVSLLMQPVANAYAQEPVDAAESGSLIAVMEEPKVVVDEPEASVGVVSPTDTDTSNEEESDDVEEILYTETNEDIAEDDVAATTSAPGIVEPLESPQPATSTVATSTTHDTNQLEDETGTSTQSASNETESSGSTTSEPETDNDINGAIDTEDSVSPTTAGQPVADENQESGASTTTVNEVETEGFVQEVSIMTSDQAIAFNRDECTEVAGGSFYCQKIDTSNALDDALFAAPDSTGDMEIYVVQDGVESKLTNNEMEDASPYFDSRSNTIVWHRLINDRYQIVSYDIDSDEEVQLTDTRVNNMEPTRSGRYTVWQRWVVNNWEIVLFDGETEVQLTNSQKHDIAPHIHGDMIIWNVRSNDGTQSLMTYEISTQSFNLIADTEGVSVVNPRMLVMYEAQYENGDSVMKGFDLITGEIVPIEHLPRELPTDLPEPDATGETRALPTTSQDEDETDQEEPEPNKDLSPTPTASSTPVVSTTTVEVSPDLDLRPTAPVVGTTTDLVVQQAAIPDVVIPAFDAASVDTNSASSSTQDL